MGLAGPRETSYGPCLVSQGARWLLGSLVAGLLLEQSWGCFIHKVGNFTGLPLLTGLPLGSVAFGKASWQGRFVDQPLASRSVLVQRSWRLGPLSGSTHKVFLVCAFTATSSVRNLVSLGVEGEAFSMIHKVTSHLVFPAGPGF